MTELKAVTNKLILFLHLRKNLIFLTISILSLCFITINLLQINQLFGFNKILAIDMLLRIIIFLSTIFSILFLPFYPLYFVILKKLDYNYLEKLSFTIISNLIFYILLGYLCSFIKIAITGFIYLIAILFLFSLQLFYILLLEFKKQKIVFFKMESKRINRDIFYHNFSIFKYLKKKVPLNATLIIIILFLLSILHGVRFSFFYGTDAMYHVFVSKFITELNYLPVERYFGALGLHIFAAVIHFFSGIDHILIAKYFSFYTFFASALIIYNILMRIFKNRNLAILGILFLETTSLGFSNMMYQFWPSSLATIQSLFIFFLLYSRLQKLVEVETPTKKDLFNHLIFSYILIIFTTISALFTHSLISMVFIVSYTFIFLIYFVKDFKRGVDFLILCVSISIFLLLYNFSDISLHWNLVDIIDLPWYLLLIGVLSGIVIIWRLRTSIQFRSGRFSSVIMGKTKKYYKRIEDKIIIPLLFIIVGIFSIGFIIVNLFFLNLVFSKVLVAIECFIMIYFGLWGLILFQKKPRGKMLFFWLVGLVIIYIGAFAIDIFIQHEFWSGRILLLFAPAIIFGFISYVYKLLKIRPLNIRKIKILILTIVIFMFFSQFSDQLLDIDDREYSLYNREVTAVQWYANYTSDVNFIICEFGWPYVLMYYDYPYEKGNSSIQINEIFTFWQDPKGFFKPSDHIYENGTNKLQQLKVSKATDIYLILDDNYLTLQQWTIYERLTPQEMEQYYNMTYLNKILISKSETGIEVPYYWVI
ncbi:MAG: hypothetical protein ACFFBW_10540 [Promethearchaeota archaeon]